MIVIGLAFGLGFTALSLAATTDVIGLRPPHSITETPSGNRVHNPPNGPCPRGPPPPRRERRSTNPTAITATGPMAKYHGAV